MKKFVLLVLCVGLLTACGSETETYTYIGESENWEATYVGTVKFADTNKPITEHSLNVVFTGDEQNLSAGDSLSYTYEMGSITSENTIEVLSTEKPIVIEANRQGSQLFGSEEGTLSLDWNGQFEEIALVRED